MNEAMVQLFKDNDIEKEKYELVWWVPIYLFIKQ